MPDATRLILFLAAVFILAPLGIALALSVLDDAAMLVSAFGVWGVAIFLALPAAIFVFSLFE